MTDRLNKIGLGGGCHWCTEAIFQSLTGIEAVEQGWIASNGTDTAFSEAVIVTFNPQIISLQTLIEIHLHTHSSTANHSMRSKYRSAVYVFNDVQAIDVQESIADLQHGFITPLITRVMPLIDFKLNNEKFRNYYYNDAKKPFCKNIINPKLKLLMQRFAKNIDAEKFSMNEKLSG